MFNDRPTMGLNVSAIAPDDSNQFISQEVHQEIFGTGNIGPDRIRLSMAKMTMSAANGLGGQNML